MSAPGFLPTFSFGSYPPQDFSFDSSLQPEYPSAQPLEPDDDSDPFLEDPADGTYEDQGDTQGLDGATRRCSVKGCPIELPAGSNLKMCDGCRGRHRMYATTKRRRRKMEKAALVHGQIARMPEPDPRGAPWPDVLSPPVTQGDPMSVRRWLTLSPLKSPYCSF